MGQLSPHSSIARTFICNRAVIKGAYCVAFLVDSATIKVPTNPYSFFSAWIPSFPGTHRNSCKVQFLNSTVACYGSCSYSCGVLWGLSGCTPSSNVHHFLLLTEQEDISQESMAMWFGKEPEMLWFWRHSVFRKSLSFFPGQQTLFMVNFTLLWIQLPMKIVLQIFWTAQCTSKPLEL